MLQRMTLHTYLKYTNVVEKKTFISNFRVLYTFHYRDLFAIVAQVLVVLQQYQPVSAVLCWWQLKKLLTYVCVCWICAKC